MWICHRTAYLKFIPSSHTRARADTHTHIFISFEDREPMGLKVNIAGDCAVYCLFLFSPYGLVEYVFACPQCLFLFFFSFRFPSLFFHSNFLFVFVFRVCFSFLISFFFSFSVFVFPF